MGTRLSFKDSKRIWITLALVFLLAVFTLAPKSATAQGGYYVGFTTSDGGCIAAINSALVPTEQGDYSAGVGWLDTASTESGAPKMSLHLDCPIPGGVQTVTSAAIHVHVTLNSTRPVYFGARLMNGTSNAGEMGLSPSYGSIGSNTYLFTFSGSTSADGFQLNELADNLYGADRETVLDFSSNGASATVTPTPTNTPTPTPVIPTVTPGPSPTSIPPLAWTFPISQADGRSSTVYEAVGNTQGMYYSVEPNAAAVLTGQSRQTSDAPIAIHSMTDGTVLSADPVGACHDTRPLVTNYAHWNYNGDYCYLRGATSWTISGGDLPLVSVYDFETSIRIVGAYRVVVQMTGGTLVTYLLASTNVSVGDSVTKGCNIGAAPTTIGGDLNHDTITGSIALVQASRADGSPFDVVPNLTAEPPNTQCGSQAKSNTCTLIQNPIFASPDGINADGWLSSGSGTDLAPVMLPSGGVNLVGSLYQSNIILDPTHTYTITLIGDGPLTGAQPQPVTVQLGKGSSTVTFSSPQQTQTIAAASYTPTLAATDYGSGGQNLYTFTLTNDGPGVIIRFACVADSAESNPMDTTGCIFLNPNFGDSSAWTAGGSAALKAGYAALGNSDSIAQDITLNPATGGAQSYVINVVGRTEGGSDSLTLSYVFGGHSGDLSPVMNAPVWDHQTTATFSISTATTNTFAITATGTGKVDISRACITTADGSTPPGYRAPGLIVSECRVVMYAPVGDLLIDTPNLFLWLWGNLLNVWTCQAEPILYGIWAALVNLITLIGFFRYWLALTWMSTANTVNSDLIILVNWGNAQILNATSSLQDAIRYGVQGTQIIQGGATFWDALVSLFNNVGSTIGGAIGTLNTLASGLIGVITTFINDLYNLLTMALTLLGSVITLILTTVVTWVDMTIGTLGSVLQAIMLALSAPPVLPPNLPLCDTSASLIPESCLSLFTLDNTLFGPNSLLGPFILTLEGSVALAVLWWAIGRFRSVLSGSSHEEP